MGIFSGFSESAPFLLQGGAQGMLDARRQNIAREEAALDRGARIQAVQLQLQGQMRGHLAQAAHDYAAALAQNPAFARQLGDSGQLGQYQGAIQSLLKGSVGAISFEEAVNGATPFHDPVYGRPPGTNGPDDAGGPGALGESGGGAGAGLAALAPEKPELREPASLPDLGAQPSRLGQQVAASFPSLRVGTPGPAAPPSEAAVPDGYPPPAAPAPSFIGPPAPPFQVNPDTGNLALPGQPRVPTPFDRPRGIPSAAPAPTPGATAAPGARPVVVNGQTLPAGTAQTALVPPAITPVAGTNYGKPAVPGANSAVGEIGTLYPNLIPVTNQTINSFGDIRHRLAGSWLQPSPAEWAQLLNGGGAGINALVGAGRQAVETAEGPANSASTRNLQQKEAEQAAATTNSIVQQLPAVIARLENEADLLDAQAAQSRKLTGLAPRETAAREREAAAAALGAQARRRESEIMQADLTYKKQLPAIQNDLAGLADARAHLHLSISDQDKQAWSVNGGIFPYHGGFSTPGGGGKQDYWVNVPAAKRLLLSPARGDRELGWNALVGALRNQEKNGGDIHIPGGGTEWLDPAAFPGARIILDNQQYVVLQGSGKIGSPQHLAAQEKLKKGYDFLGSRDYSPPPGSPAPPVPNDQWGFHAPPFHDGP